MWQKSENGGGILSYRFLPLLVALLILLGGYPHFQNDRLGSFVGGIVSLTLLVFGVYAVRARRRTFIAASVLALIAAVSSIAALVQGVRGHPLVEGAFFLFYAFATIAIFVEVISERDVDRDTMFGIVGVYLLIGVTFGTLYDLVETLHPGSFHIDAPCGQPSAIRWRDTIYFSFMTLTTVGYGDITPATTQTQSLAIIESVIGVLYVAVLIARIVSAYSHAKRP